MRDLGAVVVDILQAAGEAFPLSLLNIRQGSVDCNIGGIGFWGSGKQNGGFRQRDPCFGKTELHGGIYTCLNNGNGLRIRQSDILTSNNQQTAAGGQQIAGFKQPPEIVDSSIGVRAANGFLQSGKQIVVLIAFAVVPHSAALGCLCGICQRNDRLAGCSHSTQSANFQRIGGFSDIASAAGSDMCQGVLLRS